MWSIIVILSVDFLKVDIYFDTHLYKEFVNIIDVFSLRLNPHFEQRSIKQYSIFSGYKSAFSMTSAELKNKVSYQFPYYTANSQLFGLTGEKVVMRNTKYN